MSSLRFRAARLALYTAAAVLLWTLTIYITDGFRFRLLGLTISGRNPERPLFFAIALAAASVLTDRSVAGNLARGAITHVRNGMTHFAAVVSRPAWSVVWCLAVASLVYAIALGSRAASGADSSGYVSQAVLWTKGTLTETVPLASAVPWPQAVATFAPLGYRPAQDGPRIVPTYAPGLPMIMAVLRMIGGPCAVFFVVPICAAGLVLATYALGLRVGSPLAALAAAVLTTLSPTVLYMVLWPMSDVPVAAFWLLALVFTAVAERQRPVTSGIMTGLAILVRPNLAPLAIVPLALLVLPRMRGDRRALVGAASAFAIPVAAFAAVVALINNHLYGGPLRSGYGATGDASTLYSIGNVLPNARLYTAWLLESEGVLTAVSLAAVVVELVRRRSATRILLAIFVLAVVASYLPYIVFESWWYLRFMLPALPIVYFFGADLVASAAARLGTTAQAIAVAAFVAAIGAHSLAFGLHRGVFSAAEGEQRYVDVAKFVRDHLSNKSVIMAMQHGASIRYYAGVETVRYDLLTVEGLDQAVSVLRDLAYGPYLVLEDWEEPLFRDRFRMHQTVTTLDSRLLAVLDTPTSIRIYDLSAERLPQTPRPIRHIPRTECPGRYDDK